MTGEPVEILLVEDTPDHAEMTVRALRKFNISNPIQVVADGAEAIEILCAKDHERNAGLKLVLLDLKLPGIDGIEVLRRIRENPSTRGISVIILTASQEERDAQACRELGVHSYIVKPVDFQKLTDAVRTTRFYWDTVDFYRVLFSHIPGG
ncbi:MAG TPA: response regulator [bacterium]|nr:response regulator [bacterium]